METKNKTEKTVKNVSADLVNIKEAMKQAASKIKLSESSDNLVYDKYKPQIVKNIEYLNTEYKLGLSDTQMKYLKDNETEFIKSKTKFGEPTILQIYKTIRKGFQKYINVQNVENPKLIAQIKKIVQNDIAGIGL